VLDISRIVSGKLRLDVAACDLKAVIAAAVDTVRAAADAKGIRITVEIDPDAANAVVFYDANRVQQVVWNLLTNAVKFCQQGAAVEVKMTHARSKVHLEVSDNGPGISPQLLPYIFDRFRQGDSSTRRKVGGLGLGLSIVDYLVELHGGTVQAKNKGEGSGATFIIDLPIRAVNVQESDDDDSEKARQTDKPEHAAVRLDGLRLLVVDDEPDARRLVGKVLQGAGATVTAVATVREALAALRIKGATPHVLISDLSMPEEDGFDLIRQVRGEGLTVSQLPAVALTAFADKGYARSALLAGYQVHVPKPVDANDLIAVVASLTGRMGTSSSSTGG
jgi:CheY-like chemotaxis protein